MISDFWSLKWLISKLEGTLWWVSFCRRKKLAMRNCRSFPKKRKASAQWELGWKFRFWVFAIFWSYQVCFEGKWAKKYFQLSFTREKYTIKWAIWHQNFSKPQFCCILCSDFEQRCVLIYQKYRKIPKIWERCIFEQC